MKFVKWVSLFLVSIYLASVQVSALLDFPNLLNTGSSYEGGTLAPANTGSSFFQNLLKKINFGSSYTQTNNTQNTTTSATQNNTYSSGSTGNSSSYSPSTVQTTSYDAEYQKILKQNLGGTNSNTNSINNSSAQNSSVVTTPIISTNQQYLTQDEIAKKFETFILQVNKIRSGSASANYQTNNSNSSVGISVPTNTNNMTPQQQQQLQNILLQNSLPTQGFSTCSGINNLNDRQSCVQSMKTACQQGFLGGELMMSECSQLPASVYAGMTYGSQPSYSLDNFTNHSPYYTPAALGINATPQTFPQQYFNKEGNYVGPNWNIIGNATHYACTKKNGLYYPDNFLISTYKYITAFGQKARYGTNVGDSTNSCNFQYCGVAVPLQFINSAYGNKAAAKNQLIQITNTANLKCTVAPIQDISAIRTFTHAGSNAVIDLSLCVMERINGGGANSGNIRVQYRPLKKGEVGCSMSVQATMN